MAYPSKVNLALEAAITSGLTDSKVAHLVMRKYPKFCTNHKSLSAMAWRTRKDLGIDRGVSDAETRRAGLVTVLEAVSPEHRPVSIRQLFYLAVKNHVIEKTVEAYHLIVQDLTAMRRNGRVLWEWIEDRHRSSEFEDEYLDELVRDVTEEHVIAEVKARRHAFPDENEIAKEIITSAEQHFSRRWIDNPVPWFDYDDVPRPIMFVEKDTLLGVVRPGYGIPVISTKGQPSESQMRAVAQRLGTREIRVLLVTDRDKVGDEIASSITEKLEYHGAKIARVDRVALTAAQVKKYDLPTRPAKQGGAPAAEVEALDPPLLQRIVNEAVEDCVPRRVEQRYSRAQQRISKKVWDIAFPLLFDDGDNVITGKVWRNHVFGW